VLGTGATPMAQAESPVEMIGVRGKLKQVVAIGGETTGWAIELGNAFVVEGRVVNLLEINHNPSRWSRFENQRVEATGWVTVRGGVERKFWPVLEVDEMRGVPPFAKAIKKLYGGRVVVTLSIDSAVILWRDKAGRATSVRPEITYAVMNNTDSALTFHFSDTRHVCLCVKHAETGETTWLSPVESQIGTCVSIQAGESFTKTATLSEESTGLSRQV